VGHTFSPASLLEAQSEAIETILWSSLAMIEEREALMHWLLRTANDNGHSSITPVLEQKAQEVRGRAEKVRQMLVDDGEWYSTPEF
jgi:hypothetical protein